MRAWGDFMRHIAESVRLNNEFNRALVRNLVDWPKIMKARKKQAWMDYVLGRGNESGIAEGKD